MTTISSHQPGGLDERAIYFFDLHGAVIVRGALTRDELAGCNRIVDDLDDLRPGEWRGRVHGQSYGAKDGVNLQQIYEAGEPFERLLDHPAWYEKVRGFVGGEGTFDYHHGPLYIDECFASLRGTGEAIPMHSGGDSFCKRCQFLVKDRKFYNGQVNCLVALNDIGAGDGATMVVPGSHKANFPHHQISDKGWGHALSMEGVEGAVEVHLNAGDALLFVDQIMHGSAARRSLGKRRMTLLRYGPSWGASRHGYVPSAELLARLTPARRRLVQPLPPLEPPAVEVEGGRRLAATVA